MDIDIDTSRDRSATSSANSFGVSLTHSNLSSIPYVKRIEAQSNNISWAEQVKLNKIKEIILLYTTLKIGEKNLLMRLQTLLVRAVNIELYFIFYFLFYFYFIFILFLFYLEFNMILWSQL